MAVPEGSLITAAENVWPDLLPFWLTASSVPNGIKTRATTFYTALRSTFPITAPGGVPCANLLAVVSAQTYSLPDPSASNIPMLDVFAQLVLSIYKLLWLTNQLQTQGLISSAQATAVLTAFNTAFA